MSRAITKAMWSSLPDIKKHLRALDDALLERSPDWNSALQAPYLPFVCPAAQRADLLVNALFQRAVGRGTIRLFG